MTETEDYPETESVGVRLRTERERQGLSLEDIAAQTRIPLRHLEAIEASDWEKLPAPTYTVGFAKSYASALGMDRSDIGEHVRAEAGEPRAATSVERFEPVDPARSMPRWLVLGALAAIVLVVVLFTWLSNRSLQPEAGIAEPRAEQAGPTATAAPVTAPTPVPAASGPVVLTATAPAWIRVTDGSTTLYEGVLGPGQRYTVPQSATAPMLRAGAPEALQITVGGTQVPAVGPAGAVASNVSLLGQDLTGGAAQQQAAEQNAAPPQN